jgi:cysteine desulfurase
MKRIYLDHAATTPLDERVLEAMVPYFSRTFGNASSVHWHGQQAKAALEQSRETLARAINASPGEIHFTSGGTESDNSALRGAAYAAKRRGRNHIITTLAEHHAVIEPCEALAAEGFEVTLLPVDSHGRVDPDMIDKALKDSTALVSVMHANNEVGTIAPIKAIARCAHERGVLVHTDAVQSVGKIPVDVEELEVDLLTFSAHKTYGPKGVGALYVRKGTEIDPLLRGGGQERGRRPGTENVPLAVGFAKAVELALADMHTESHRLMGLRDQLENRLTSAIPAVIVNGHPQERLPHVLNISLDSSRISLEGEMLLVNLDLRGISAASGSACSSGSTQPSHVLLAMGRDRHTAKATLRFSFGRGNTFEEVDSVVQNLCEIIEQAGPMRGGGGLRG